jgi:heme exporter protein A
LASLDAKGRELVVSLISTHLAGGGIVLAATHDPIIAGVRRISLGAAA